MQWSPQQRKALDDVGRWLGCPHQQSFYLAGYAGTCHKAQGSQWDSVLILDESGAFKASAKQWLYTAITRAAVRVTIAR